MTPKVQGLIGVAVTPVQGLVGLCPLRGLTRGLVEGLAGLDGGLIGLGV